MQEKIRQLFPSFTDSILNSYSQIFFSNNKVFSVMLLLVSFFDLTAGVSGVIAVVVSNGTAFLMGFNRKNIRLGYYGFNSLLVGLGLGIFYQFSFTFLLILIFASAFTLFVTISLEGVIGKYGLPYLSFSFLISIWMVSLAAREFSELIISDRGIYISNELYIIGGSSVLEIYQWFNRLNIHESIIIYFRSLGAIFFQYNLMAGVIISIGILIYSRISFSLSIIGFFSAYIFYQLVGGNIEELSYSYIGFNFILSAIAVGGFFILPSKYSYLSVILLIPILSITITSTMRLLDLFQLSIYSLPLNMVVLLFLYVLKFRERFFNKPEVVFHQQFSPEKNLYTQLNNKTRFSGYQYAPILLPFWGEWMVSQGHHGEHTHREGWAHAWDFEIKDDFGSVFKNTGLKREDYYCYNKPVICPADGIVEELIDYVDENEIGDMNLEQNWGNTIVIKHAEHVYSKLSHLKKDSFKVIKGEQVKQGQILAHVGSSGRSPLPHLHFQIQETPFIGSKTLDYPLAHYIRNNKGNFEFKSFDKPLKNDAVMNIEKNTNLSKAFHFIPGQQLTFEVKESAGLRTVNWEVQSDIYNNTFLFCTKTKGKAWFKNDGKIHYFTHYEGKQNTLLYYFFLGSYKIINGFYKNLKITDSIPIHLVQKSSLVFLQDFIAPFYMFLSVEYILDLVNLKDNLTDSTIQLNSTVAIKSGKKIRRKIDFEMTIESNKIKKFVVNDGNRLIEAGEIASS